LPQPCFVIQSKIIYKRSLAANLIACTRTVLFFSHYSLLNIWFSSAAALPLF
jgi:hypothetical protein